MAEVELHPFEPFLPARAKLLMLGSFPPQPKRWCIDFYYPNFTNDMWRIMGLIFFQDKDYFILPSQKKFDKALLINFLTEHGIALYDTATAVRRLQDNASDKFLEVVEPTDIAALIARLPHLRAIVTTGEKAAATVCASLGIPEVPKVNTFVDISSPPKGGRGVWSGEGASLWRLPSSSRAYPLSFEKKVEAYRKMFDAVLR